MANIDHTQFTPAGPPAEAKSASYWWRESKSGMPAAVFGLLAKLEAQQNARLLSNFRYMRLYGDTDSMSSLGYRPSPSVRLSDAAQRLQRERITFNVVRMAIDTLAAKIAKNRPKPTFVTDGGNWGQQQRAKKADKWIQGHYHQAQIYAKSRRVFLDACVCDIGALKFYRDEDRVCAERIWPGELLVDEHDGRYGEPRQLFQTKAVSRTVLKEQHGAGPRSHLAQAIDEAKAPHTAITGSVGAGVTRVLDDLVQVMEAWRLPSAPGAGDGRHVIALSNATLIDEPWRRERFPFAFFRWSERLQGFWGQGVAEQMVGIQVSVNKKLKTINAILHLMSVPRYFVDESSDVVEAQLNNQLGAIVKYRGTPPQIVALDAVPKELWASVDRDVSKAFELIGLSQLSVASKKPAGLDAAVALREYNDIESERFVLVAQQYEDFHLECAQQIVDISREIAEVESDEKGSGKPKYPGFSVAMPGKAGLERVNWDEVQLDEDKFILKVFPTSSLPTTPAARQQTVAEWQQNGWVDELEARRLLDMPDLDSSSNVAEAARDDIEAELQRLLDGEDYRPPEPLQDLVYGMKRFTAGYLRGRHHGVSQETLERILQWRDEAFGLLQEAQQAQAAAMPPPGPGAPPPAQQPASPPSMP